MRDPGDADFKWSAVVPSGLCLEKALSRLETFRDGVIGMAQSLGYRTFVNLADGMLEEVDRLHSSHRNYWLLPRQ